MPSSEVDELRSVVRDYLSATSPSETVRKLMATDIGYDEASWRQMAGELGLQGIVVPERWGGAGAGVVELAVVFEEMGRALVCSPSSPPWRWRPRPFSPARTTRRWSGSFLGSSTVPPPRR